jgi:molecular chaperone HtpG
VLKRISNMNVLEIRLNKLNPSLASKLDETKHEVEHLLDKYSANFPTYTDHSIKHTLQVFEIASEVLNDDEIESLNADELYILSMACLLHDIGMCLPESKIQDIANSEEIQAYKKSHPGLTTEEFIRDVHHSLSHKFIMQEWEALHIPSPKYARAIGLVAEGHRKVDLGNFDAYDPHFFAKTGKEFVCLPFLASILRIADELDITNSRTPKLLTKYYMPNNERSVKEWQKHIATSQRNYKNDEVIFEVDCSDQNIYAALQDQFEKIQNVINYCQKVIRSIPSFKGKHYSLTLTLVKVKFNFIGFDPKGIKFSFDVQNVVTAFVGEDLYKDHLTSLREAVQNAIDSCRYKSKVLKENYKPHIKVTLDSKTLIVEDNGAGMDEFIIEHFFGRLASSFYEQEKVKAQFEAIGQFGVGVFSYFLLSEYIDIETKMANSASLKFRFDKDPKSYFHFYDKPTRSTAGTTITMHLKEAVEHLVTSDVERYLKKTFKHIEIPIELDILGNKSLLQFVSYKIDSEREIRDRLKLQHKRIGDELVTKTAHIDDEHMEGLCALIIHKDYAKTFSNITNLFDREQFYTADRSSNTSQISISQKGVFVNYYSSAAISLLIGEINLKTKIQINLDRKTFQHEDQIYVLISKFEALILRELFEMLEEKYNNDDERLTITNDFLENYLHYSYTSRHLDNLHLPIFRSHLHVSVFVNGAMKVIKLDNLTTTLKEFIFLSEKEDRELISSHFNRSVVIFPGEKYDGTHDELLRILKLLGYELKVELLGKLAYLVLSLDENDDEYKRNIQKLQHILGSYDEMVKGASDKLFLNIWTQKPQFKDYYADEFFVNYNHPFIQFILATYDDLQKSSNERKILKSTFGYAKELFGLGEIDTNAVDKLNDLLKPLDVPKNVTFRLEDFE